MAIIEKDSIKLLEDIRENNNRPWFGTQKERYDLAKSNVQQFKESLFDELCKIDKIERSKLFRIYRDVRFSKDKTPYNSHWSMSYRREKPYLRGGYYLKISPEGGYAACGFWSPSPSDLALIRSNIDLNSKDFKKAINHNKVKSIFGKMVGETVKSSPRSYKKDHPEIELLRHKQFVFSKEWNRKEVHSKKFLGEVIHSFKAIRPFFNHMSDILSHNLNGEPLY